MKARFAIALLTVAMLCACALAQEDSAEDWFDMGRNEEAISAFDEGLKTDPQNASAWHHRGMALAGMGHGAEANQSIQKAMELIDQRLPGEP